MGVSLDLRKSHQARKHGDLVAVLTWVNDGRALVLVPHLRRNAGWYILDESASWKWNIYALDPAERRACLAHAEAQALIACEMLGIEPSRPNRTKIIGIIVDTIPELIRMPSAPQAEFHAGSFGQMLLKADGKPLHGDDIRLEKEGAEYV